MGFYASEKLTVIISVTSKINRTSRCEATVPGANVRDTAVGFRNHDGGGTYQNHAVHAHTHEEIDTRSGLHACTNTPIGAYIHPHLDPA
jgi:hypothetical protein